MSGKTERPRPYLRDPDDPEYIKDLQRPAVIKEDLSEMERRKRVQQILDSKSFCHELEEVIRQESDSARSDPDHLHILQKLSDLTLSQGSMSFANLHTYGNTIPISDLKGNEKYSKSERIQRNKLASLFRLSDLFQWSQGIHNEITYRMNDNEKSYLMNPYGLLYHEITAGTLIKLKEDGTIIDSGISKSGVNKAAFNLHTAIYQDRPMIKCILHMHTAVVAAVASMKCGLLPLCQEAMVVGAVGYHDFLCLDDGDVSLDEIVQSLRDKNVLFLRHQGFLIVGESIEHAAFLAQNTVHACETQVILIRSDGCIVIGNTIEETALLMRNLVIACENQVRAARAGIDNLIIPNEYAIKKTYDNSRSMTNSLRRNGTSTIDWNIGELEWESWMRVLDHAHFRTGHIYRQPQLRSKSAMSTSMCNNNDIAVPPTTSAYGMVDESDSESVAAHRLSLLRKEQERIRWLSSPSNYQKIEILEYGADNPKKITKWVQDTSTPSVSGTPVKINNVHQFSPASKNPKEFKDKQKVIKENRRLGTTTAGPQSQVLGNCAFENFPMIIQDHDGTIGQSSRNDRAILIGTASKGIIDRQYQHHAQVYHQIYAPNPFAMETDENIQRYLAEIESKNSARRTQQPSSVRTDYDYSQYDDIEADTASLMQGVREHKLSINALSASEDGLNREISISKNNEKTSEESAINPSYVTNSVMLDYFSTPPISPTSEASDAKLKSISTGDQTIEGTTTSRSFTAGSKEETAIKEGKKKKKKGLLSFMRKKEKPSN